MSTTARRPLRPSPAPAGEPPPPTPSAAAPRPAGPDVRRAPGAAVRVVAHRGSSAVAPENTLAAFEAARRAGAVWVEADLHRTRDGVPVVLHDPTLDATTDGRGSVDDWRAADLAGLDAGAWFSPAFAGARVPLLPALLAWAAAHAEVHLLLELKDVWDAEGVAVVVQQVRDHGLAGRVVVQGFEVETLSRLAELAPDVPRGLLVDQPRPELGALVGDLGLAAVNPRADLVAADPQLVDALHGCGVAVWVWTVDDADEWGRLVDLGVDAVITNRPDRMLGWAEGRGSETPRPSPVPAPRALSRP